MVGKDLRTLQPGTIPDEAATFSLEPGSPPTAAHPMNDFSQRESPCVPREGGSGAQLGFRQSRPQARRTLHSVGLRKYPKLTEDLPPEQPSERTRVGRPASAIKFEPKSGGKPRAAELGRGWTAGAWKTLNALGSRLRAEACSDSGASAQRKIRRRAGGAERAGGLLVSRADSWRGGAPRARGGS